jgi:hypothetical protein
MEIKSGYLMYFALVYYPRIEHEGFQAFRSEYEPYSELLPEHVTFVFPTPEDIGWERLDEHIISVLSTWEPFKVHFCRLEKTWDHWLYLGAGEGHDLVVKLHDQLYEGILRPYLRKDLPFYPHIVLGLFSLENYNMNNPTAKLTLDAAKYKRARKEFEDMRFDFWCTIDRFTLLNIDSQFTECVELKNYKIHETD